METYTYDPRPIWLAKDYESYIIRSSKAIVMRQMLRLDPVEINLMVPSDKPDAKLYFETPVGGLCCPSGRHVYLLRDLPPLFLARATAHELDHAHQAQQHLNLTKAQRERSSEDFELQFMKKLGWPTESNLIRSLANACDFIRDEEQSRIEGRREFVRAQERILANLKAQRGSSKTQMAALTQSIWERNAELAQLEAELARL